MTAPAPVHVTGEKQPVGVAYLNCEACGLPVPVTVEIWLGEDEDGDECLFTEANTLDLEMHLVTHGPISMGGQHDDN